MKFLRTVSTQRLLAMIATVVVVIAGGTAIAVAASGTGPVPRPKRLSKAVHDALAAPAVKGITARISFTNHLISSNNLQGSDPILQGASGRLWLAPNHLRLELQAENGEDAQAVVTNRSFWVYDPTTNTVYKGTLPPPGSSQGAAGGKAAHNNAAHNKAAQDKLPTVKEIQANLNRLAQHTMLSGAIPSDVGGRPTYTVRVSPQHDGGLLGAAELAWDSVHGVPLRFAVYARGDRSPVLELKATNVSYGPVSRSAFNASYPRHAKVVNVAAPGGAAAHNAARSAHMAHTQVTGVAAVQRHLSFTLVAPSKLVGLPRQSVTLLNWDGTPASLVTYGQNLGGIAVVQQSAKSASSQTTPSNSDRQGLNLPTVSIRGVTGQELDTALGTVVRFTRNGVAYTVLGSVPAAAAEAAARAL